MPYNGAGVFTRVHDWTEDKINAIKINASRMDDEFDGIATALSTAWCRDGQSTVTNNIPMSTFIFTGLGAGTAAGHSVRYEQVVHLSIAANQTITRSAAGTVLTLESTDAGATSGPDFVLHRNSASPTASDIGGSILFNFDDSAGNADTYARIKPIILDATSTSEDGKLFFGVVTAGTLADEAELTGAAFSPATSDGLALGTTSLMWADIFFASGAVLNFNNGDVTITHAANTLAFAGGTSYTFDATITPAANDGAALGTTSLMWSDVFIASGGVINFNNGDVTATHSANTLTFAGASSGYIFDAVIKPSANDGFALGVSGTAFSDLFLASGGVINWNAANITLTHSASSLTMAYSDDTAGGGPNFTYDRNSTTPASNDVLGIINFTGRDSGAGTDIYTRLIAFILDPTATAEEGQLRVDVMTGGTVTAVAHFRGASFVPGSSDGQALGTTSLMWADLFLASGGVINWNNGDVLMTHSANTLTFSGASSGYVFDAVIKPSANDGFALGVSGTAFSDLFLASGAVINFNAGNVTLTHSAGQLTMTTAATPGVFSLESTEAGATIGPQLILYRNSATPAAADVLGAVYFQGEDSAGNLQDYARIYTVINDTTSTSEDAELRLSVVLAGTLTDKIVLDASNFGPMANDGTSLGVSGTAYSDLFLASGGVINWNAGNMTITHSAGDLAIAGGSLTLTNTGLHLLDTNASHDLIIAPGSNLTADRTFTLTTGDAARTLDISAGSVTISAYGATLTDDADAATARSTLGLGTSATVNTGTSGATIPLLNANNTISGTLTSDRDAAAAYSMVMNSTGALGTQFMIEFQYGGANKGEITVDSGGGTTYSTTSDERRKLNRKPLREVGQVIDSLEPIEFDWDAEDGKHDAGFSAQHTYKIVPNAVRPGDDDPVKRDGDQGFKAWMMDAGKFMPYVIAELKSLRARVQELESEQEE